MTNELINLEKIILEEIIDFFEVEKWAKHTSLMRRIAERLWGDKPMHLYAYVNEGKWKGSKIYNLSREDASKPAWKYHMQQMVLAEDPIKYINNNCKCIHQEQT